jgi:TMEM175 potassium channel family protein
MMSTNRLEAFSDGVIAVIITIMVLELKVPSDTTLTSLRSLAPQFLTYLLSFLVVAIMWVNHHHLLHSARGADARLLWSNNTLLFWMSLVPFVTAYMGNNHRDPRAVALYGVVLSLCSVSFLLLRFAIVQHHRGDPDLVRYHRRIQFKNLYFLLLYIASVPLAFVDVRIAFLIFVFVAFNATRLSLQSYMSPLGATSNAPQEPPVVGKNSVRRDSRD